MAEKETRNFALRDKDGNEIGVFTGKQPRQAALKQQIEATQKSYFGKGEPRSCIYSQESASR